FFQAEDGIRDRNVTGVQTCALPILRSRRHAWRGFRAVRPSRERAASPYAIPGRLGCLRGGRSRRAPGPACDIWQDAPPERRDPRSEEHTSELQSRFDLVCRLLLEKK